MAITRSRAKKALCRNALSILTLAGVIIGILAGVGIRSKRGGDVPADDDLVKGISIPGDLLLRGLNLLVLPLVVTSLIVGLAGNRRGKFNAQAGYTILYYISTTLIAAILGVLLVTAILYSRTIDETKTGVENTQHIDRNKDKSVLDFISDMVKNLVPKNMVAVAHMKTVTDYESNAVKEKTVEGMNMLGVIAVSIAFGVVMMCHKEDCKPLLDFCTSLNFITNRLVRIVLWYSPIGIMFLVMTQLSISDVSQHASLIGLLIATVLSGLAIHLLIILPGILFFFTGKNPITFYKNLLPAMATAFGTASSAVTIPLTMKCTQKAGVSSDVVDFVIPVGATVNMDGTALYEAVACLFIAQLDGITLSNGEITITVLTATVAAIGAAGIPSAGLVTLVMVLNAVNLSTANIALVLSIDWFLDRFRTMVNVVGDAVGCAVIERLAGSSITTQTQSSEDDGPEFHKLKDIDGDNLAEDNAVGA